MGELSRSALSASLLLAAIAPSSAWLAPQCGRRPLQTPLPARLRVSAVPVLREGDDAALAVEQAILEVEEGVEVIHRNS